MIVSLGKLDRVRAIDTAAGTMTAEASVILENAHKAAEAENAIFPLWLTSQGSARIGGVLSSNAGGINVVAYGNARELTMGKDTTGLLSARSAGGCRGHAGHYHCCDTKDLSQAGRLRNHHHQYRRPQSDAEAVLTAASAHWRSSQCL